MGLIVKTQKIALKFLKILISRRYDHRKSM